MFDQAPNPITTFDRIIKLIDVTIWPVVCLTLITIHRRSINRVVQALAALAERADELKLWQLEIKRKVDKVADSAQEDSSKLESNIPEKQRSAASEIKAIVSTVPSAHKRAVLRNSVRKRMVGFASDYDRVRREMTSGQERTAAMNVIMAKMRSLGLAARSFLSEFSSDQHSAGMRLAAIAILQVSPSSDYLPWLFARFDKEQPFAFFQAALAILQAVRKYGPRRPMALARDINASIRQIESFKGIPDENTLRVLRNSLAELRQMHPEEFKVGSP